MDYEDYICGNDRVYDFESNLSPNTTATEPWDIEEEDEWDSYSDWVYEGEFTDIYDDYYDQF
jgi:hypothetical protein